MDYYGNNDWRDYIAHYGTPRHSGRYPWGSGKNPRQGTRDYYRKTFNALYKSKSANLDKWGKDKDHNVLYLTGLSGSGKSTLAIQLAKETKADVVHLDFYFNRMSQSSRNEYQSKEFNKFLDDRVPNWRKMPDPINDKYDWSIVDDFAKALEDYGKAQFTKGRKVIAEGVELMDNTLYDSRRSYSSKPYAVLNTSAVKSLIRGNMRDDMVGLDAFYRIPMYLKTSKIKSDAVKELALEGQKAIDIDKVFGVRR